VLIPRQNVKHLMLDQEVIEAVKEGKFSIWAVSTIDEGLEVLTGVRAGKPRKDGFTANSVHAQVKARLKKLLEDSAKLRKELTGSLDADKDSDEI
jgi:predicted ATP-dependent protease